MTDIIKRAGKLLKAATDGPWEINGGEIHQIQHTPAQCTSIRCNHRYGVLVENWGEGGAVGANDEDLELMASAREMAEAVASMHWEYRVLVKGNSPGLEERIFDTLEAAQKEHGYQKMLHLAGVRSRPTPIEVRRATKWEAVQVNADA